MHSAFYRRSFLIVTAAILGYALYRIIEPMLGILGWTVVLSFILYPVHERLTRALKGRPSWSAGIIAGLTPLLVFVPLSILGAVFAGQVARMIEYMKGQTDVSYPELVQRISSYPLIGNAVAWVQENTTITAAEVQGWLTGGLQTVLKAARRAQLLKYLGEVTRAVVFGSAATALVQGVIVGIGFAIVKLPSAVVFGVLAAIAAFLPTGAALVMIPAVIYLLATGRWGAAIFLAIWTLVMWASENILRPLLTAHHAQVSTLAIFIGAIGGVAAFGILGLIIGPVLLSFIVALVRFSQESPPADA